MKKRLIMVSGTLGAGKSAVCRELNQQLAHSVWLDGDWCWMMDPFNACEENRRMVEDNITHVLNNFLKNPAFEHVIFNWVMDSEDIFALILGGLTGAEYELHKFTLTCSPECLRARLESDIAAGRRDAGALARSLERRDRFAALDTVKLDTTQLDVRQAAERIKRLLGE